MRGSGVLRALLRPFPLGLLALALGLATGFAFLGQWQLSRSQAVVQASPALERPRPLTRVLAPAEGFRGGADGQVVTATGRFGADLVDAGAAGVPATGAGGQVLLAGRDQGGREGSWVVAPFRVEGTGGAEPPVLAVVLGWVDPAVAAAGVGALPAPPAGEVELTGRLLVGEPPQSLVPGPDGAVLRALAPADLVNVWEGRPYTGFVIAAQPAAAAPLVAVASAPPLRGTDWRSFSYALQWWLFAGFAVFFWWRLVRDRLPDAGPRRAVEQEDLLADLEARRAGAAPSAREGRPAPSELPADGPPGGERSRPDRHDHVEAR